MCSRHQVQVTHTVDAPDIQASAISHIHRHTSINNLPHTYTIPVTITPHTRMRTHTCTNAHTLIRQHTRTLIHTHPLPIRTNAHTLIPQIHMFISILSPTQHSIKHSHGSIGTPSLRHTHHRYTQHPLLLYFCTDFGELGKGSLIHGLCPYNMRMNLCTQSIPCTVPVKGMSY